MVEVTAVTLPAQWRLSSILLLNMLFANNRGSLPTKVGALGFLDSWIPVEPHKLVPSRNTHSIGVVLQQSVGNLLLS